MWWVAEIAARGTGPGGDRRVLLRVGGTAAAADMRSVEHQGTRVTVLGHCAATADELRCAARAIAGGSTAVMIELHGSYTAIAETSGGEVYLTGDLAGQCRVFHGNHRDGTVVAASHAWRVAAELGDRIDRRWLGHPRLPRRRPVLGRRPQRRPLDIMLCVLAQALATALRARLPGYATVTPDVTQRRFLETPGQIITTGDTITVRPPRPARLLTRPPPSPVDAATVLLLLLT